MNYWSDSASDRASTSPYRCSSAFYSGFVAAGFTLQSLLGSFVELCELQRRIGVFGHGTNDRFGEWKMALRDGRLGTTLGH